MTAKLPLPQPPVLVAGLGRAGEAALELLTRTFGAHAIFAWDAKQSGDVRIRAMHWRARGVRALLGGDGTDAIRAVGTAATIVKSPGIDMDVPLLRMAAEQGVEVIDELELGWRACAAPVVAVTGTNGKSTTCALVASVLARTGHSVQRVGNTEFGPPLSAAAGATRFVCEVSSFQLEAAPTFLPEVAIFTNLSLEHLPRHRTMKAYGDTKQLMFVRNGRTAGLTIVSVDDLRGRQILAEVRGLGGRAICYGFAPNADVRILKACWTMREAETVIGVHGDAVTLRSSLPGRHNALNIAAAFAYGYAVGLDRKTVIAGIASASAPAGRWELIGASPPFDVVVDYAHTPDGIAQFLNAARSVTSERKTALRTVFGAVGLPDPPKARGCAEVLASLSDHLILTTGSAPRSARIPRLQELRDAAGPTARVEIILDRRQAVRHAVSSARPGDVVAILGLGALNRLILDSAGTVCPYDDRDAAREALRLLVLPCAS